MRTITLVIGLVILAISVYSLNVDEFSDQNVFERELVQEVTAKSILSEHDKPSNKIGEKNFKGTTLAYVTPCYTQFSLNIDEQLFVITNKMHRNNKGYDIAKVFNCKFDYVSPVWYRVTRNDKGKLVLAGRQDVDQGWITDVRATADKCSAESRPKIVPRFHFEGWSPQQYAEMFGDSEERIISAKTESLINAIVAEVSKQNFDGIVLDQGYIALRVFGAKMYDFLIALAQKLHDNNKVLILVVPPVRSNEPDQNPFISSDFVDLMEHIDYFSLMTYDYSSKPGPNAPLPWITHSVLSLVPVEHRAQYARKILLGLNFYGYDFAQSGGHEAVLGNKIIELLSKKKQKLEWDEKSFEHFFNYKDDKKQLHVVYYPTLKSIQERLEMANSVGLGISIWEIGQGMDYFYDLL